MKVFWPFFLGGLVSVLTITNPLSKIPMFISLTPDMTRAERTVIARRASLYGFAILTVSLFAGVTILAFFGISYGALRIAGGLTIALLGFRMLFDLGTQMSVPQGQRRNVAFFPLALPGIGGPGAIAVVIGISSEIAELASIAEQSLAYGATMVSIVIACAAAWITMCSADWVSRVIGDSGLDALNRLNGFLLVCIGVQFVGSGVRTFIAGQ